MSLTKLVIALSLLTAGQTPSKVFHVRDYSGTIKPNINAEQRDEIAELHLMYSPDQGNTWKEMDHITPDKESFVYRFDKDGEYWLQPVVLTKHGQRIPSDKELTTKPPEMKLFIDSKPPELRIKSAQREDDDLVVSWLIEEEHPNHESMKLEYRAADATTWTPIPFTPGPIGSAKVHLSTSAPLVVRLSLMDLAKNFSKVEAQVPAGVAAAAFIPPAPSPQPVTPPATNVPMLPPIPAVPGDRQSSAAAPGYTYPQVQDPIQNCAANAGLSVASPAANVAAIASTADFTQGSPVPLVPSVGRGRMPPLQLVNDSEIVVEYEVSKIGPSGLSSVEVWLTRDGGAHWSPFAKDDEADRTVSGKTYKRTLKLPGDGVYGLTLVVKSKAGMGRTAPRPGDLPEMLIEVDTLPPDGKLLDLVPDPQQRDTIILNWTASDRNLASKPITLEWSEQATGPWQMIAQDVEHTCKYVWHLPPAIPSYVYLKMTVRDSAGNQASAITRRPQLVDVTEPESRLIRVTPANKR
jgi:hypothetical protein